ncbi:MAG TPA: hypothetical protein VGB84_05005 [Arachidicoccus sp.]
MTSLYANLLVRYIYDDVNEHLKVQVKHLLQTNSEVKEMYLHLKESTQMLHESIMLLHPQKSLVENILRYAAG